MKAAQTFPAPAKLNLFLHIVGQRADGYHLLQSVFRLIDFGDELTLQVRADGKVALLTPLPGVPVEKDLCVRAARLLQQHTDCPLGVDIALRKTLPMGGGVGGGSSDAATMLLALNRLWQLDLPRAELQMLALRLGADVPIFVFGRNAFAEGVGEQLTAIELPPEWYVVLTPPAHVATADIFKSRELTRDTKVIKMADFSPVSVSHFGHNDLQTVATRLYPVIAEYIDWLKAYGDARMTGSGACVFAPFDNEAAALDVFSRRPAGYNGFVARGLDRHPLWDFAQD